MIAPLVLALLAQAPTPPSVGERVDLTAAAGASVYWGRLAPGARFDPGAFLELSAHLPLAPHFAIGLAVSAGSGTWRLEEPAVAPAPPPSWLGALAASAELRWSALSGHLWPFVGARLGWMARDFGGAELTHGPLAGVSLGLDVRPWPQRGLHLGVAATPALALVSNARWPVEAGGYVLRADTRWGDTFKLIAWAAFAVRLGWAF